MAVVGAQRVTVPIPAGVDLEAASVRVEVHLKDRAVFDAIVLEAGVAVSSFAGDDGGCPAFVSADLVLGGVALRVFCRMGDPPPRPDHIVVEVSV